MHLVLERKNQQKRFFLSKSMPNFNFAELIISLCYEFDNSVVKTKKNP